MPACRICGTPLTCTFADLGMSPLANSYVRPEQLQQAEYFYPLHVHVCSRCLMVQLQQFATPDAIFSDYAYFSSYSTTWLEHCRLYTGQMMERFAIGPSSLVVEVASNDGYLLQYFHQKGIPVLGIEPAANVAEVARERGIETRVFFFSAETARTLVDEGRQ